MTGAPESPLESAIAGFALLVILILCIYGAGALQ